jgi:hypothetical protein
VKAKIFITSLLVVIISGCVPSLHRLWTKETLVYDEAFVGKYEESKNLWMFTGNPNDKSYELVILEEDNNKKRVCELRAHLVKIEEQLFFDFYPEGELHEGLYMKMHLIAAHTVWKVEKKEKGFALAAMNPEEVAKLLNEKPELVRHECSKDDKDRVVLTDTSENLQTFLVAALKLNPDIFGESEDFVRMKD